MQTTKATIGTRTKMPASMADLGSIVRLDPDNFNAFVDSFVFDKALQLIEAPVTNPIVHNLSSSLFPYTLEVFHHNLVSIKLGNNVFTDVVVNPSHITSFSSAHLPEKSFSGTSAFGLQFTTQIFEFPFNLLDFRTIIEPAVRCDSEVVYSEVNAQNSVLRATVQFSGINLFRECEDEEAFAFLIHPENTFIDFPSEVIFVADRDVKVELLPSLEKPENKLISFDIGTSREVVSDRGVLDYWLGFGFLDNSTGLSHTSDSYLRRQLESLSYGMVDSVMEFEVLGDFMLPRIINTELESFSVCFDSSDYLFSRVDSDFSTDGCSHEEYNVYGIYKCFGGEVTLSSQP